MVLLGEFPKIPLDRPPESGRRDYSLCEDVDMEKRNLPADFDFALFYGFFYSILGKAVKPLKIEGLFCPYYGFEEQFQIVVAAFAYIPVGYMKVIAPGKGIMNSLFTNIAGKGFHGIYTPCWSFG
jgi:hypothetical protein